MTEAAAVLNRTIQMLPEHLGVLPRAADQKLSVIVHVLEFIRGEDVVDHGLLVLGERAQLRGVLALPLQPEEEPHPGWKVQREPGLIRLLGSGDLRELLARLVQDRLREVAEREGHGLVEEIGAGRVASVLMAASHS